MRSRTTRTRRTSSSSPAQPERELVAGQIRILRALARCNGSLPKRHLAVVANVQIRNGTMGAYLRALAARGMIEDDGKHVRLLRAGAAIIGQPIRHEPPTTHELLTQFEPTLIAGQKRIMRQLIGAYPRALSKHHLSEQADVQIRNGSLGAYLRKLRALELAHELPDKTVKISDAFFLRSLTNA